jgi:ATP-dependent protease ClpP protease subunit
MKNSIEIRCSADRTAVIDIEGTIGIDPATADSRSVATYEAFNRALDEIRALDVDQITVNIRSTGGNVADALLIYDALCVLDTQVVTRCHGYTASAATIIAQAASEGCREIMSGALYLIHRSVSSTEGNAVDLQQSLDLLTKTDERLAAIYSSRSGREVEQIVALMNENGGNGRWLTPAEALDAGLVDRIIDSGATRRTMKARIADAAERLMSILRPTADEPMPRAVLDIETAAVEARSSAAVEALHRGQERAQPTSILSAEDPSDREAAEPANAASYSRDADAMREAKF